MPTIEATTSMSVMSVVQNRAVAAGSIIRPTARSVPRAWKPPTRLSTTRPRKMRCVGVPARLTERRKVGSTHSRTSGRKISARVEGEHGAEEDVQEIDVRAAQRDNGDAERQGQKIEGGERRVLPQVCEAGDE